MPSQELIKNFLQALDDTADGHSNFTVGDMQLNSPELLSTYQTSDLKLCAKYLVDGGYIQASDDAYYIMYVKPLGSKYLESLKR